MSIERREEKTVTLAREPVTIELYFVKDETGKWKFERAELRTSYRDSMTFHDRDFITLVRIIEKAKDEVFPYLILNEME